MDAETQAPDSNEVETTIREDTQRIGKFALIERLGRGSSGTVYKALDTFTGQEVALKVLDVTIWSYSACTSSAKRWPSALTKILMRAL